MDPLVSDETYKSYETHEMRGTSSQSCLAVRFPEVPNRKGTEDGPGTRRIKLK